MADIDVAFVVDETGSMGGHIEQVKKRIVEIAKQIESIKGLRSVHLAICGFRDHSDDWVSKTHVNLTEDHNLMLTGVASLVASGGGDTPEAVNDGLLEVLNLNWRCNASHTCILIGDAPPHGTGCHGDSYPTGCPCGDSLEELIDGMKESNIVVHTVWCGSAEEDQVWRTVAKETFGKSVHLTKSSELVPLVVGIADVALSMQMITEVILKKINELQSLLLEMDDERDRIGTLFNEIASNGSSPETIKVKATDNKGITSYRDIEKSDIENAINSLRPSSEIVAKLFPRTGIAAFPEVCSLISLKTHKKLPLIDVKVNAKIIGLCSEIELSQSFVNDSDNPLECTYQFPIDDLSAVCGLRAEIDGKEVIATIMDKSKAATVYDNAIASGKGAYLLEQKRQDLVQLSVGNLPPGKVAIIHVTCISQLELIDAKTIRFSLPMTVAPKFGNSKRNQKQQQKQPQNMAASNLKCTLSINTTVQMPSDISLINSPTHGIIVESQTLSSAVTRLKEELCFLDSDFVLQIHCNNLPLVSAIVEEWNGEDPLKTEKAVSVTFIQPSQQEIPLSCCNEMNNLCLLIDCSISMHGSSFDLVKEACTAFLNSLPTLPPKTRFNVVKFGSKIEFLFTKSRETNDQNSLSQLDHFINTLSPNMGGSRLKKAFESCCILSCSNGHEVELLSSSSTLCCKCSKFASTMFHCQVCNNDFCFNCAKKNSIEKLSIKNSIILLSDASIAQESKVKSFVQRISDITSIYPICIGNGSNRLLTRDIARITGGSPEFCIGGENAALALKKQLQKIFYPLQNVNIQWETTEAAQRTPSRLPPIISDSGVTLFALIPHNENTTLLKTSLTGQFGYNEVSLQLSPKGIVESHGKLIHRLYAHSVIKDNSQKPDAESEAIIKPLALKYSLTSKFTSFVATEERHEATTSSLERIDIPTAIPHESIGRISRRETGSRVGDIGDIEGEVHEVNAMFRDMSRLVASSACAIDSIECNCTMADLSVQRGILELTAATSARLDSSATIFSAISRKLNPISAISGITESIKGIFSSPSSSTTTTTTAPQPITKRMPHYGSDMTPWQSLLDEAGTSEAEFTVNKDLHKSVLAELERISHSKPISDGGKGYVINTLSSSERSELIQAIKNAVSVTRRQLICGKNHPLIANTLEEMLHENPDYKNGFKCDSCGSLWAISDIEPLHCSKCGYDLCLSCILKQVSH